MDNNQLERFSKNKNKKRIAIAFVIGLILVIGGISLYRTFALYEEKEEFNVLEGKIADFSQKNESFVDYIESLGETEELAYDETEDNNLRYIGANPNNYVSFNNELWRVIGVMNDVEDENGDKASKVKIIRDTAISRQWNSSASNNWETSALQTYLNESYYNGLNDESKNMISSVVWNLGGHSTSDITASTFYTAERGNSVYSGNPTTWIGKVALIYASDFGFSVGGSERSTCLSKNLSAYSSSGCKANAWLNMHNIQFQWVLTHASNYPKWAYALDGGSINSKSVTNNMNFFLSVYLDSNVVRIEGTGTSADPFVLDLV